MVTVLLFYLQLVCGVIGIVLSACWLLQVGYPSAPHDSAEPNLYVKM